MTIWTQPIALIAVLAAAQAAPQAVAAAPAEAPVMAGAAAVKITPPLGVPLAGYYHERGSTGVHDDLHAKALVLEAGGTAAALVALDLIATQRGFVEEARKRIEAVLGIPGSHVMISATHAHTGPVLPSPSRRSADLGGAHPLAVKYIEELPGRILEAVTEAHRRRAPARVLHAAGRAEGLAFNRRFHMQDGTVGWNPGKLNPGILRPAGPVDAEAPLVVCEAPGGKPVAAYVNFAMHLDTVGGLEVSADYPHTLSALLAAARGEGLVTLFTIGTAGDLNHINVAWADGQKGHGEAARIGTILAAETLRAWERLELAAPGPLWAKGEIVGLALPELEPGAVEKAEAILERRRAGKAPEPAFLEVVEAYKVLDVAGREGKPLEAEVQVIALGRDIAWVGLPGEVFVELGLAVKHGSPFRRTIIAELANGSIGYIPTRRAHAEGNYEPVSARCAPGSGEKLAETALRLLREAYGAGGL